MRDQAWFFPPPPFAFSLFFRCVCLCGEKVIQGCQSVLQQEMTEPLSKKQRLNEDQDPEVKYTQIFINNEWVNSGKL